METDNYLLYQKERSDIILKKEAMDDSQQNKDNINNCIEKSFLEKK